MYTRIRLKKDKPKIGDKKFKTRFAILPRIVKTQFGDDYLIWLERYTKVYEYETILDDFCFSKNCWYYKYTYFGR